MTRCSKETGKLCLGGGRLPALPLENVRLHSPVLLPLLLCGRVLERHLWGGGGWGVRKRGGVGGLGRGAVGLLGRGGGGMVGRGGRGVGKSGEGC